MTNKITRRDFLRGSAASMCGLALTSVLGGTLKAKADDVVSLKWVTVGSGMPSNYDSWAATVNAYLEEQIGVNIEMEVVSWGDWDDRRNIIINTNEAVDIIFGNGDNYYSCVDLGAYTDISGMIEENMPGLCALMPEEYWDAVKVGDAIYAVPTYKDSSLTNFMVWTEDVVEKYGIDTSVTDLAELTDVLLEVKEGEGDYPVYLASSGLYYIYDRYDKLGSGLNVLGVRYDDETAKVVYTLEQEDVYHDLEAIHDWYTKGIINADAPYISETQSYMVWSVSQGWPSAGVTTWGPGRGADVLTVQVGDTILSNETVQGSINSISANCKNPEKALQFLDMVNTDTWVRDMFYYGEEGVDWEYNDEGTVTKLTDTWTMAGYTQATFFTVTTVDTDTSGQWDEVKEQNENAVAVPTLGFALDTTNISDQIAQCSTIWDRYASELNTGVLDPETAVPEIKEALMDAGFQDILDEAQAQVDAWLAEQA